MKKVRASAELGAPDFQLLMGLAGTMDPLPGFSREDGELMMLRAAKGGQPKAQRLIGLRMLREAKCAGQEDPRWEPWLRAAVRGGDSVAQVFLASTLLERAAGAAKTIREARSLLETAAESADTYAVKHAIAILSTSPIEAARNPALALQRSEILKAEEHAPDPSSYEIIAAAHAVNGRYDVAISNQKRALSKAKRLHWDITLMQARLTRYEKGELWTGDLFAL